MLDEEEKYAALSDKKKRMWSLFTYLSPQFFFPYTVNSIQFNLFRIPKNPLQGVNHMDIEIVRAYIYTCIYKVIQIIIEYSVNQLG